MNYQEFYNNYIGKRIDIDKVAAYQCVDISKAYGKQVWDIDFRPVGYSGGAKDMLRSNACFNDSDVERIRNSAFAIPPRGAIAVFDSARFNPWGHTGVVTSATIDTITVLEQNGGNGSGNGTGSDAIREKTYRYTANTNGVGKVLGWIIPRNGKLLGDTPPKPKAWENWRGPEQQKDFAYINDLNADYLKLVESGECSPRIADIIADRDQEIKDNKVLIRDLKARLGI